MPAFLLAAASGPSPELDEAPRAWLAELCQRHAGRLFESAGGAALATFELVPHAIECALAVQARFAEHNRARGDGGKVLAGIGIHVAAGGGAAGVADGELRVASLLLGAAPPGRVLVSRSAYTQAQGGQVCCFIPLGMEYFSGLPDALEVFEAVPLVGRPRTLSSSARGTAPPAPARPATRLPAPARREAPVSSDGSPAAAAALRLAAVAVAALTLFAARSALSMLLVPLAGVDYVFSMGGITLVWMGGSAAWADAAGLWTPVLIAAGLVFHFWRRSQPLGRDAALFWLGQTLFGLGAPIVQGAADPDSFAAGVRGIMLDLVARLGLQSHGYGCGAALVGLGCLAMAAALVSLVRPLVWPEASS